MAMRELVIFGDQDFAEIAYEYFTHDSEYKVVAFTVDQKYLQKESLFGLPVLPFEKLSELIDCKRHYFYAAVMYSGLNKVREEKIVLAKSLGLKLASYISSSSFIWRNVELGEHNFIFEGNVLQPFVTIGNNNVIWSSNHIGHHSAIGNSNFISSEVGMSGWVTVEDNCFIGVNCTISNGVRIGKDSWVSEGSSIGKSLPRDSFVPSNSSAFQKLDLKRLENKLKLKSSARFDS
jgi:sugar O-acyltransferase (sialic acid O-acetyltransferase NeuD family)